MALQYHSHPTSGYLHIAFLLKYIHDKIDHRYTYIKITLKLVYFTYPCTSWGLWLASLLTPQTFLTRKRVPSFRPASQ